MFLLLLGELIILILQVVLGLLPCVRGVCYDCKGKCKVKVNVYFYSASSLTHL